MRLSGEAFCRSASGANGLAACGRNTSKLLTKKPVHYECKVHEMTPLLKQRRHLLSSDQ